MSENVLVMGAHQNDALIAVGGLLRKLIDTGHEVSVVCFGNGDEAFTTLEEREGAPRRFLEEAVSAHACLGVKRFVCHDVPDYGVLKSRDAYRKCIEAIRTYQPGIILGHFWAEYFQHHEMATLSRDAWFQAGWDCSADLGRPWRAAKYYHFEVIQDLPEPTHLVDVSDTFAMKLEALSRFKAARKYQDSSTDTASVARLEARARHHGEKIGVRYAEALKQSFFTPDAIADPEALF